MNMKQIFLSALCLFFVSTIYAQNVGINTTNPNGELQFGNTLKERKIVLWEDQNQNWGHYGLGITANQMRYHTPHNAASHIWYAGNLGPTTSTFAVPLMNLTGTGNLFVKGKIRIGGDLGDLSITGGTLSFTGGKFYFNNGTGDREVSLQSSTGDLNLGTGGLTLGAGATLNTDGSIRWNGANFQFRSGGNWFNWVGANVTTGDLSLTGGLTLGGSNLTVDGSIRYQGGKFEFRQGGAWVSSLTSTNITAGRVAFGSGAGTVTGSDWFHWDNTNNRLGIGLVARRGRLSITPATIEGRKIVLYDGGLDDDNQYYGFGIGAFQFLYQGYGGADHIWRNGTSAVASTELMRIKGATGNVGIGIAAPLQKLEVDGAIKIGNTTTNTAGSIRYDGTKFQVNDGTWKDISVGGGGGITGTLTAGQVPYATGASAVVTSAKFVWDNANGSLLADATTVDNKRKLVVWDDATNNTQFYGIGTTALNMRYNTFSAAANHVFTCGDLAGTGYTTLLTLFGAGNMLSSTGATLTIGGVWTNASDRKLKKNIKDLNYGLNEVLKLRPVSYNLKADNSKNIGFVAQEVEKILPELVFTNKETKTKSMSYGQMTSVLVNAVKELNAKIEKLEAENAKLKADNSGLIGTNSDLKAQLENLDKRTAQIENMLSQLHAKAQK